MHPFILGVNSYDQICQNKIESRVIEKLSTQAISSPTNLSFFDRLLNRQNYICQNTKEQIHAVEELQSHFSSQKKPLIIKGFSAAVLCDCPEHYRYSGDVDVFFYDIDILKETLITLGYHQIDETPAPHEDSFFVRDNIFIEIHKYFPILMEPHYNVCNFTHKKQLNLPNSKIVKLDYNMLYSNSTMITNSCSSSVLVTNIEMTLFLLCAHIYKDLFWQPYQVPKIRLIELFEINDLMHHPEFDLKKLYSIAQKLDALHVLAYVFTIIKQAMHLEVPDISECRFMPIIKLTNDAYAPYKLVDKSYFSHLPSITFSQIVEYIGYVNCCIGHEYCTCSIDNVYHASANKEVIDYSFSVSLTSSKICYQIQVSHPISDGDNFCIMLDNDVFTHIWFDSYPNCCRIYGVGDYSVDFHSNNYSVCLYFDKPLSFPVKAVIAVGNINSDTQSVTVSPINITK